MPAEQMESARKISGHDVQASINVWYQWRDLVMTDEQFQHLLAAQGNEYHNGAVVFPGVFTPSGGQFEIVAAEQGPYGWEISDIERSI